jgi:hypothetical protein
VLTHHPNIGSSLEDFLEEEGILEEARFVAAKEALEWLAKRTLKLEGPTPPS